MTVSWHRLGRIFKAEGQRDWMRSHTACPVVLPLSVRRWRVYFGTRDAAQRAHIGFIEIDPDRPGETLDISADPALTPGDTGLFDQSGVYPGSVMQVGGRLLMYYMGRLNLEAPRYAMAIGLAESFDGGLTFQRVSRAPLIDRNGDDPWMVSTPCVVPADSGWRMWFLSGKGWTADGVGSFYALRQAHSQDAISWTRESGWALDLEPGETNIASPAVLRGPTGWTMWFCTFVGGTYRVGYASSPDGVAWLRNDDSAGLGPSAEEWDRDTVAYPHVFSGGGRLALLYSGRGYGLGGIGLCAGKDEGR